MKKIITCLMALAVSVGMMKAADSFLYNHYSENFSAATAGDWGSVDSLGAVSTKCTNSFNVDGTNQNLVLKVGGSSSLGANTGKNVYKHWFQNPIISPDSITISFIYRNTGTTSSAQYLYFCDTNRKPIFGIGCDRSKNSLKGTAWVPRLPLKFVSLKDSTKNFWIDATLAPELSTTDGGFKVTVTINFATKTYSFSALKGTYTALGNPNFVAGTAAPFVRNNMPFLDNSAGDLSWLMNTMGATSNVSTGNVFGYLDDISITQIKPYVGDANVSVNSLDQEGNVVKTYSISAPIGQRYKAVASDLVSFDANGFYYLYDAANTSSLETTCTADGLAKINIKFTKAVSHNGPFTWAAQNDTANWNESEANFVTALNEPTAYQMGRSVIFNGADSTRLVQLTSIMDLKDQDWTINGKKLIFKGAGTVKTSGNFNLNLAASDSIQIQNANLLTGNAYIKGGTTTIANSSAFGSAMLNITSDASIVESGSIFLSNNATIADGATFSVVTTNSNYQGYSGKLFGNGDLKFLVYGPRNLFGCNLNQWGGKKITMVAKAGLTSSQLIGINSDSTLIGLANRELALDSFVHVSGAATLRTATIGALSGSKSAVLGALIDVANTSVSSYWKIGSLNTNTEFAGTINNSLYMYSSTANRVFVEKVGTGSLTLSGTALAYTGNTNVTSGKLILKGNLNSQKDTVYVAADGTLEVIGARALDANNTMQYTNGTIAGDIYVNGTLAVQSANLNTPNGLYLNANSTFIAKVESDSVPAASTQYTYIDPVTTLKIAPVKSYNAGDVFRVFSAEAAPYIIGSFGTVADAEKWDVSKLYVDGTVKALAGGNGTSAVKAVEVAKVSAYFINGTLIVTGLQEGDTFKVVNTSGVLVDSTVKLPKGLYIVVVKTAKGNVKLKVANF